jgi:hypothetical protein
MGKTRTSGERFGNVVQDDIQRLELHDIPFATPHICRICGGRISGSYLAEIHFGGVVTFRCLAHAGGLGPTIREGKDAPPEEEGRFVQRLQRQQGRETQPSIPSPESRLMDEKSAG